MDAAQRRLAAVREGLTQLSGKLRGIAIQLWDGTVIPSGADAQLKITIADEGVIAALMKRPSFDTIVRLYALGRLQLAGGSFFALAEQKPILKPRELVSSMGAGRLAKIGALFLTVPPGSLRLPEENSPEELPEAFYRLFLDPEMVYSSAYFETWDVDLDTAQRAKLDLTCRKLRLKAGDRLLDIGCGWGALLLHAAERYGVSAHGITTSPAQYTFVQEKIAAGGLKDRVSVALEDWSATEGTYDKIASISLLEHVPLARHPAYFQKVRSLLAGNGLYLQQSVTRRGKADARAFGQHRPEYRAVLEHVLPGAEVDHLGSMIEGLEASRFEIHDVEGMREHYARTSEIWCRRLTGARPAAHELIGGERTRLWIAYFAGASLAFRRGTIGMFQILASARTNGPSRLPPTRADLYL
jgi:cyclopropane-fatty-acyl-phospholipid synthase